METPSFLQRMDFMKISTESDRESAAPLEHAARPSLRWRSVIIFFAVILILTVVSFLDRGVGRAYYGALAGAAALALAVQYRRETRLTTNRLLAIGVVTDCGKPLRSRFRFINAILSRLTGNVPRIKYSFVAFDQRTYTGQTGWAARSLYKGARVAVLYDPGRPVANHPLGSFIFYSFRES